MQFYLDGVRGRDPYTAEPSAYAQAHPHGEAAPTEVDVLIVGCGPAGLTLAAQLSAFAGIRTAIVEQKEGPCTWVRPTALPAAPWRCSRPSTLWSVCSKRPAGSTR